MAAPQAQPGAPPSPALLQAVLRRDLPAVEALLASGDASLSFEGLGALHAAALADWGAVVPLLVAAGAALNEPHSIPYAADEKALATRLAPLGLSAAQLAALQPLFNRHPPLWLAVRLGACDAAAALLTAGAELGPFPGISRDRSAWAELTKLAAAKSAAAGSAAAASEAVPPLVQRMAVLLLEARPLAARLMSSDCLVRLGNQIISGKLTTAALPALLQLDSMREVLRHDAQHLPGRPQQGEQCGNAHTLVVAAAATGQPEALDALLAAGGAITLQAVNAAVQRGVRWDAEESMVMLRLLLSRGVPAVPAEVPDTAAALQTCPIYVLLERQEGAHECAWEDICVATFDGGAPPTTRPLQQQHLTSLCIMDALAEAGYRPATFRNVRQGSGAAARTLPSYYPPDELAAKWELDSAAKWLWLAAQRPPWSPANHAGFPPTFRAAARAFLLAAHRLASEAATRRHSLRLSARRGASLDALGALPPALLLSILGQAAHPLSAWRPVMHGGKVLGDVHELMDKWNAGIVW